MAGCRLEATQSVGLLELVCLLNAGESRVVAGSQGTLTQSIRRLLPSIVGEDILVRCLEAGVHLQTVVPLV